MTGQRYIPKGNTAEDIDEAVAFASLCNRLAMRIVDGNHHMYESCFESHTVAAAIAPIIAKSLLDRRQQNQ